MKDQSQTHKLQSFTKLSDSLSLYDATAVMALQTLTPLTDSKFELSRTLSQQAAKSDSLLLATRHTSRRVKTQE